jgi:dihydrofolate reductase
MDLLAAPTRLPRTCWAERTMTKVRASVSMSLDGLVAGSDQSWEDPLGVGGLELHRWLVQLAVFRETHGEDGDAVNASTPVAAARSDNVGASITGRNMFGRSGPWGEPPWNGFWGREPPYHHPVFVLTHHTREPLELRGGTSFRFVTDGIESAGRSTESDDAIRRLADWARPRLGSVSKEERCGKLIESTLVSHDGVIGDPPTWADRYCDEEAVRQALDQLLVCGHHRSPTTSVIASVYLGDGTGRARKEGRDD